MCQKKRKIKVKKDLVAKNGKIALLVCICKIVLENLILPFFVLGSWAKTQEVFPCCKFKLFTLKAQKMSVSLGLTGLEFSCDLGIAWCGGCGRRLSSLERIVALEGVNPKTIVWFSVPRGKISSDFLLVELAAVDVAVFPLSRHLGSGGRLPALQWGSRLS